MNLNHKSNRLILIGIVVLLFSIGGLIMYWLFTKVAYVGSIYQPVKNSPDFRLQPELETEAISRCGNVRSYRDLRIALQNPEKVCFLQLSGDKASAPPVEISSFHNLVDLSIYGFDMPTIPDEILALDQLIRLNIQSNNLRLIDNRILNLKSLRSLELSRNSLSEIPTSVFLLPALNELNITNNGINKISEIRGVKSPLKFISLQQDKPISFIERRKIIKLFPDTIIYFQYMAGW